VRPCAGRQRLGDEIRRATHLISSDRLAVSCDEQYVGLHHQIAFAIEHTSTGATATVPMFRGSTWSVQTRDLQDDQLMRKERRRRFPEDSAGQLAGPVRFIGFVQGLVGRHRSSCSRSTTMASSSGAVKAG
jgi:hypothetical protein